MSGIQQGRGKEFRLTSAGGDKTGEERVPPLPSRTLYVFRPPEVPFLFLSQTPASQVICKLVPERNGALSIYEKNPEISVVAKVEFPIGKKLFHLVVNPGTWLGARPWTWNWYKLRET